MTRRVFYSFDYERDSWRASQVRNIDILEGNSPVSANAWEEVKKGRDLAIKKWINRQLQRRTCTVVLVGSRTANRKWINYEIHRSWELGMGVVGIRIHKLKNQLEKTSHRGKNPFNFVKYDGVLMSSIVNCYCPKALNSAHCYNIIRSKLKNIVEEAIQIRKDY